MKTLQEHVEVTPGTCGGRPRITGTRIRVQDIVIWTEAGMSPDEIAAGYPHLTLADIHAALAYYHDHRELIDEQIRQSNERIEQAHQTMGRPRSQH
jgi:uncharacterized protein (DUF433 family)